MAWQKAGASAPAVKDNSLALFKNTRRRGPEDPAYSGSGRVNGRDYWVSGWVNESRKDGSKYISIKVRPKEGDAKTDTYRRSEREQAPIDNDDMSDDIPF